MDNNGQPTVIPAPFYVCNNPLCMKTGCILAILCSKAGGAARFNGFPPPIPPPGPPADTGNGSPTGSASQSIDSTTSSTNQSSVSTTTSTSDSSSSGTCPPITTVADPGPTSAGDSDDGSRRRVRRTLNSRILVARDAPIDRIGTCRLTNPVKIPPYSSFSQAMNLNKQPNSNGGANGKIYNAIEKWYAESLAVNGTPFLGPKLDSTFGEGVSGSIDHIWEKSKIGDFLASLLGSGFDCDDMNSLFSSCGNKLQKIFDQLPSMDPRNVQIGFAAMNRHLNGMKGWMFSQGFSDPRFGNLYNSDDKVIQGLQRQAIIFNWFNFDTRIQSLHDETNNRIYGAFLALDDYILTNKIQRANGKGDLTQRFGPSFRTWYEQLLTNIGSATYRWASDQITRLDADTSLPNCLRRAINAFQFSPLYSEDKFKIDQSHLSWKATPISLKRSLLFERDDACTLATSVSPSVTSILTRPTLIKSIPSSSTPPSILRSTIVPKTTTVPSASTTLSSSSAPLETFQCYVKSDKLYVGSCPSVSLNFHCLQGANSISSPTLCICGPFVAGTNETDCPSSTVLPWGL